MEKKILADLFKKYHEGTCTEEEKALLEAWYLEYNEHELDITPRKIKGIGKRVFRELPGNHTGFIKIGLMLAAAAIIIGALASITIKYVFQHKAPLEIPDSNDIAPGRDIAVLTLSSGKKINLNNAASGQLASQPGLQIVKTAAGQVTYELTGEAAEHIPPLTNNISTPKGGQWQVILPDGTKVWLNSASSLSYPATFEDQANRTVLLNGEGYFEVAKDKHHPFIVKTEKQSVEVLGTHFDISSYSDDPATKTTLAEGSIKISDLSRQIKILVPGQQALLSNSTLTVMDVNVEEALAWKNGYFRFNDENIKSIMRKLSRWYNVDIQYEGDISSEGLTGKVSRSKNISKVLKALEATKTVHFKVSGRRITVVK